MPKKLKTDSRIPSEGVSKKERRRRRKAPLVTADESAPALPSRAFDLGHQSDLINLWQMKVRSGDLVSEAAWRKAAADLVLRAKSFSDEHLEELAGYIEAGPQRKVGRPTKPIAENVLFQYQLGRDIGLDLGSMKDVVLATVKLRGQKPTRANLQAARRAIEREKRKSKQRQKLRQNSP